MHLKNKYIMGAPWWKFDSYEIRDGCIRPAANAKLEEYDPWQKFLQSRKTTNGQPPYQQLIQILSKAGVHKLTMNEGDSALDLISSEDGSLVLPREAEQGLLAWCSENGLLGMLTHMVSAIALAARWKPIGRGESVVTPTLIEYKRYSEGWSISKRYNSLWPAGAEYENADKSGALVSATDMKDFAKPHVLSLASTGGLEQLSLTDAVWPFFPCVPESERETFEYPQPLSGQFWRIYSEPLRRFLASALYLRSAAYMLNFRLKVKPAFRIFGVDMLNRLLTPNARSIRLKSHDAVEQEWHCPSLLSSFAEMILDDIREGHFTFQCPGCQTPFVTSAYQARYCSPECRHRLQKRDLRRRMATAEDLFASGKGVKEVASEMHENLKVVRTWYRNFIRSHK